MIMALQPCHAETSTAAVDWQTSRSFAAAGVDANQRQPVSHAQPPEQSRQEPPSAAAAGSDGKMGSRKRVADGQKREVGGCKQPLPRQSRQPWQPRQPRPHDKWDKSSTHVGVLAHRGELTSYLLNSFSQGMSADDCYCVALCAS